MRLPASIGGLPHQRARWFAMTGIREDLDMAKETLTDEQVETEIRRLKESEDVRLARREIEVRKRRRKYLYHLRQLEKRGQELRRQGVTWEQLHDDEYLAEMLDAE